MRKNPINHSFAGPARGPFLLGVFFLVVLASCSSTALQGVDADRPIAEPGAFNEASCVMSPGACFGASVAALGDGRPEEAAGLLRAIMSSRPSSVWAKRSSLVLGRAVLDRAVSAGLVPASAYLARAEGVSHIEDYRLFYLAEALGAEGDHPGAAATYERLLSAYPGSALAPGARYRMAEALSLGGDPVRARNTFDAFITEHAGAGSVPDALLWVARISLGLGEPERAASAVKRLRVDHPGSKACAEAERIYASAAATPATRLTASLTPSLSVDERFTRAGNLFSAAMYEDAAREYAALARSLEGGARRDEAALKSVRALVRMRRYTEAEASLRELAGRPGGAGLTREVLSLRSLIFARTGRLSDLETTERELERQFPRSPERAEAMLFIARHHEQNGNSAGARRAYARIIDELGGGDPSAPTAWIAAEGRWRTGWIAYGEGRFADAYAIFSGTPERSSGGMYDRFQYWAARSAQKTGDEAGALQAYGELCSRAPDGYYCLMATERGVAGAGAPERAVYDSAKTAAVRSGRRPGVPSALRKDAGFKAAAELAALGFTAEAAAELDRLAIRFSRNRDSLAVIAGMLYSSGDFHRALRIYENHLKGRSTPIAMGRALTPDEVLFPQGLVDLIRRADRTGRADPYLVAAVMREESAYDPDALSRTGAVGLMQIMPETGAFIALRLGRKGFESSELRDPETNILFGAWYLAHLSERFGSNVVLTVAGYNAGPGAAERWLETLPSEVDEFIESIPYNETRIYAKRVLRSLSEFRRGGAPAGPQTGLFRAAVSVPVGEGES